MLYALGMSLKDEQGFNAAAQMLTESFFAKLIAWGLVSALLYHFFAGIKHLVMDFGYWEELDSAGIAAKVTLAISVVTILLAGVWIW